MADKLKVYISGPMSGIKDNNYQRFYLTEFLIEHTLPDLIVINPASITIKALMDGEPADYKSIMKRDLDALMECDLIYLMDGYKDSEGAMQELALAKKLKLEIVTETDFHLGRAFQVVTKFLKEY